MIFIDYFFTHQYINHSHVIFHLEDDLTHVKG